MYWSIVLQLSQQALQGLIMCPYSVVDGYRCSGSIVTYGAWGSGKSYTLGTLERQQLATAAPDNETAGVLSRCAS